MTSGTIFVHGVSTNHSDFLALDEQAFDLLVGIA